MENVKSVFDKLCEFAPIELSYKMIEKGDYDNSGVILHSEDNVDGVVFSLDLSEEAVRFAKKYKCNTIVTHHPAIYSPVKTLSAEDGVTGGVVKALGSKMNVISMHLNLDVADSGIDFYLAKALGAESYKILDYTTEKEGYGREFKVKEKNLSGFIKNLKVALGTKKVIYYGGGGINRCASFCGAGGSIIEKLLGENKLDGVDLIVSSDLPHHVIKKIIEKDKKLVIIPHYPAENYGFKKFYERAFERLSVPVYYFEDKRFM